MQPRCGGGDPSDGKTSARPHFQESSDRRKQKIFLTPKAKRLKQTLLPQVKSLNDLALYGFTPDEKRELTRLLLKIHGNIEARPSRMALQPIEYEIGDVVTVAFDHDHMAVADDAAVTQPDELRLSTVWPSSHVAISPSTSRGWSVSLVGVTIRKFCPLAQRDFRLSPVCR